MTSLPLIGSCYKLREGDDYWELTSAIDLYIWLFDVFVGD